MYELISFQFAPLHFEGVGMKRWQINLIVCLGLWQAFLGVATFLKICSLIGNAFQLQATAGQLLVSIIYLIAWVVSLGVLCIVGCHFDPEFSLSDVAWGE